MSDKKDRLDDIILATAHTLHEAVERIALESGRAASEVGGDMVTAELDTFETRSFTESSRKLLGELEDALSPSFSDGENRTWNVKLKHRAAVRLKLTAREFGQSLSHFTACLLATGLNRLEVT
jgi:hypothetical protein